jgi:hypothetical protein
MDVGQRSGVFHCFSRQSSNLDLSEALHHCHLAPSLSCVAQKQNTLLQVLKEMAKKIGFPESYIVEKKLDGGWDWTVTVER